MKLLRTPPLGITLFGLLAFATATVDSGMRSGTGPGIGYVVVAAAYLLFTIGWSAALIRACSDHTGVASRPWGVRLPVIATAGLVLSAILALLGLERLPPVAIVVGVSVVAYFALMLVTARSLALAVGGHMDSHRAFGYFILIVYLPLGIWALKRRIAVVTPD